MQPSSFHNQRQSQRVALSLPVQIKIDSQITLQGQLKDLSSKSAFIKIKGSTYMQTNDEVGFAIQRSLENAEEHVQGLARIVRIEAGEGITIYFTKMDETSTNRLKDLMDVGR